MGSTVTTHIAAACAMGKSDSKEEKKAKLLNYRRMRLGSWKQILLKRDVDESNNPISGLTAFRIEFEAVNDSYGDLRLNLQHCLQDSDKTINVGLSNACVAILRNLMAIKTDSIKDMSTMRALGRHHALQSKQDRIEQLFAIMLRTIAERLGLEMDHIVIEAWRFHFDAICYEMTRDKIKLYPELHTARISSMVSSSSMQTYRSDEGKNSELVSRTGNVDHDHCHSSVPLLEVGLFSLESQDQHERANIPSIHFTPTKAVTLRSCDRVHEEPNFPANDDLLLSFVDF